MKRRLHYPPCSRPWRRLPLLAACLAGSISVAHAQRSAIVVPVGQDDALIPTTRVAVSLAERINKKGQVKATVTYFAPNTNIETPGKGPARAELRNAMKAFQALDFARVRAQAKQALDHFKLEIEAGGSPRGYVETQHLMAATELFDSRPDAAQRAMRDAVVFWPTKPSKRRYNPTVQTFHKQVVDETERATLSLKSAPEAVIWINNIFRGLARGTIKLRPGLHWVRIFRPGFMPWSEWLRLEPGQTEAISAQLQPAAITESARTAELREAAQAAMPSDMVQRLAQQTRTQDVIIVYADDPCTESECSVRLRWAKNGQWIRSTGAVLDRGPASAAAQLLGEGLPAQQQGSKDAYAAARCALDSDCPHEQHCEDGACVKDATIWERWWFWTAVGAAVAAGATATALILSQPEAPVIDIR